MDLFRSGKRMGIVMKSKKVDFNTDLNRLKTLQRKFLSYPCISKQEDEDYVLQVAERNRLQVIVGRL